MPSHSDDDWTVKNLKLDPELMKNDTKSWSELYGGALWGGRK